MKLAFLLLLSSFVFCGFVSGTENYSDMYDNIDLDAILNSDRLLNQYIDCILDKGSCTADARTLKRKRILFHYFIIVILLQSYSFLK